ncbi:MAG: helix-turn-helix transcriptional regulator [Pseudomonadota bacterium]
MSELKNTLRARRTDMGYTQAGLAEKIGVSRKTINTIENNVFTPSTTLALKLAHALETTVEDLFQLKAP